MKNVLVVVLLCFVCVAQACNKEDLKNKVSVDNLEAWLKLPENEREPLVNFEFAKKALTKNEAENALVKLLADKQATMLSKYKAQWNNRELTLNGKNMPFFYQIFGNEPSDGRSLFISLHGGGGTTADANNQQYNNQKHLYDATMNNLEGVYLAPRAPSNSWNLWHQSHIDDFLNVIIQMAVIKENVNPNKVYILGYSAGGDGVYQLAPRMTDRWAAASMMAGHPNESSPLGLRNLPFALHMGALDAAYDRNEIAQQWKVKLDDLQTNDTGGYIHDVQIHEGMSHWMKLKDAVALPWMKKYKRNPVPTKVVWKQDDVHHETCYWLKTPKTLIANGEVIVAEYDSAKNEINILENYSNQIQLMVNDRMLDLDKAITIKYQGNVIHQGLFHRSILSLYQTISKKGDINLSFPCILRLTNNSTVVEDNIE